MRECGCRIKLTYDGQTVSHTLSFIHSFNHSLARCGRKERATVCMGCIVLWCTVHRVLCYTFEWYSHPCCAMCCLPLIQQTVNVQPKTGLHSPSLTRRGSVSFAFSACVCLRECECAWIPFSGDTCVPCVLSTLQPSTNVLRACVCACVFVCYRFFSLQFLLTLSLSLALFVSLSFFVFNSQRKVQFSACSSFCR